MYNIRINIESNIKYYLTNQQFYTEEEAMKYIKKFSKEIPCIIECNNDLSCGEILEIDELESNKITINAWNRENYEKFLEGEKRRIFY